MNFTKIAAATTLALAAGFASAAHDGFTDQYAQVNGVKLHYQIGGKGSPVVLLHGYAQTGHMWGPAMAELVKNHTVIVPDMRGNGDSEKPTPATTRKPWPPTSMHWSRPSARNRPPSSATTSA